MRRIWSAACPVDGGFDAGHPAPGFFTMEEFAPLRRYFTIELLDLNSRPPAFIRGEFIIGRFFRAAGDNHANSSERELAHQLGCGLRRQILARPKIKAYLGLMIASFSLFACVVCFVRHAPHLAGEYAR